MGFRPLFAGALRSFPEFYGLTLPACFQGLIPQMGLCYFKTQRPELKQV